MKKVFVVIISLFFSFNIFAASDAMRPKQLEWPFDGPFGVVDRQAAQRGFQVYREVCAACHSLNGVAYRNLTEIGFSADEVKQIASEYMITDGPNDRGEMFERPGLPSDIFKAPYANDEEAKASNGGSLPPDLSLMVKARVDGANYLHSLLTGYQDPPEGFHLMDGLYYNPYFPGGQLSMPAPLISEGQVSYMDGTRESVEQMSQDLVVFLQWASEPEMEHRKSMGVKIIIYLSIFILLFYIANNRVWSRIKK